MKLRYLSFALVGVVLPLYLFSTTPVLLAQTSTTTPPVVSLSEQELANLVKPSVVRVVTHYKGDIIINPFALDFKEFKIVPSKNKNAEPIKIPVDTTYSGTGFVVRPDGYIVTNSHVVSDALIRGMNVGLLWLQIFTHPQKYISSADIKMLNETPEGDVKEKGTAMVKSLIRDYAVFQGEEKVVIVNAETQKSDSFEELEKRSMPAKVVAVNHNFLFDDRDVALLHIEANNLPALSFAKEDSPLVVGAPIYVMGFPASAKFGEKDFTESTFTRGIVSALKDSEEANFKVYQTDAKVSHGSSGSPFLRSDGLISGVVAFQTKTLDAAEGDNFAFAIPNSIINTMLSASHVQASSGAYETHFRQGLVLLRDRHCEKALAEFAEAGKTNEKFPVEQYLQPYVTQCKDVIARGDSIDTKWDEYRDAMRGWGAGTWSFVVGAPIAIVVLIFVLVVAVRRLRKDENLIKEIADDHNHHTEGA